MEYISSFIYCDSFQTEFTPEGPRYQIVNPLQVLTPITVPSNYSFCISCNLAGFDPSVENDIQFQFFSPTNQVVYDTSIKFKIPEEQLREGKPATMQFNMDLRNLVIRELGLHYTKIIVNNHEIGNYMIDVIVGEANETGSNRK